MPRTVFVKPGPHPVVLMPERNMARLPADGMAVELNAYWRRRLAEGDVIEAMPTVSPATPAQSEAPTSKLAKTKA